MENYKTLSEKKEGSNILEGIRALDLSEKAWFEYVFFQKLAFSFSVTQKTMSKEWTR